MDIETYLKHKGISQAEFAKHMGVTQGAVWQWISGESRITAERALEIEKKTGGEITRQELRADLFGKAA